MTLDLENLAKTMNHFVHKTWPVLFLICENDVWNLSVRSIDKKRGIKVDRLRSYIFTNENSFFIKNQHYKNECMEIRKIQMKV